MKEIVIGSLDIGVRLLADDSEGSNSLLLHTSPAY